MKLNTLATGKKLGIPILLSSTVLYGPTTTASAEPVLEEVLVTAQRREQSLQEIPLAVTAMGSDQMETQGFQSLTNFSEMAIPGLTAVPFAASPTITSLNIRGISTADPQAGLADSGVAVYLDGIVLGRAQGNSLDLIDAERVEILRGPQGTLFGRNAAGGAVQYISKRPTGELSGKASISAGNYDARRLQGHIDLPEFSGVSVKLSALSNERDGFTDNRTTGVMDNLSKQEDFGLYDAKGFRLAALWQPSDNFNAYYTYDYSDTESTPDYTYRTGGRTPSAPLFCQDPRGAAFFCSSPQTLAANIYTNTQQPQSGRVSQSDNPSYVDRNSDEVQGHTVILDWQISPSIQVKSLTGYRELDSVGDFYFGTAAAFLQLLPTSLFDGDPSIPDFPSGTVGAFSGGIAPASQDQDQFSQELQIIGDFDRFEYTGGLYYFTEELTDVRDTLFSISYLTDSSQPGVLVPVSTDPFVVFPARQTYEAEATSYAAYLQGTYTPDGFEERLSVSAGLRYTDDEKEHTRIEFASEPDSTNAPTFTNDRFDGALSLSYKFTDAINGYLRYATGYRAGGTWIRNKQELTTYDPDEVVAWEAGLKTDLLDGRMRFNIATYQNTLSDYQISVINDTQDPSSTDVLNVDDDITIRGVENELMWLPITNLAVNLTYTYQNIDAPDTVADFTGTSANFTLPNTPENQASIGIDWTIPIRNLALIAHVDYAYQDDYFVTSTELPFVRSAPSDLTMLNARLTLEGLTIGASPLKVSLWGRNVTDEDNFAFTFAPSTTDFTVAAMPGGAGNLGAPRTYGIDVQLEF